MDSCGCKNYQRIGQDLAVEDHFPWHLKIGIILGIIVALSSFVSSNTSFSVAIHDFIKEGSLPRHVKYLLYIDAMDSLLVGDASRIDRDFGRYDCDLLALGSWVAYPDVEELK